MMYSRRILLTVGLTAVLGGCASATGGSSGTSSNRNVLTRSELMETNAPSVYDAVRRLRPRWLRPRGFTTTGTDASLLADIPVYRDGVRAGGLEMLETMEITSVVEVHYISATDATTRWGTGHRSGAIEVITR